jgi:type IX secretion system PorP/SprF family membrane protein
MKKSALIIIIIILGLNINAQQIPPLSQYVHNHYAINPAASGVTDDFPVSFTFRKMWTGISAAPSLQNLSGNLQVAQSMGAGISLYKYQAGPLRKIGLELTYSYHINLNEENKLAFGLSGMLYQFFLDKRELTFENPDDDVLSGDDRMAVPDVSFGTYLYGKNYFAGVSVPQLINKNIDLKTDKILQQKQVRHYYIFGGYDFQISSEFMLKPSLLVKLIESGVYQVDINALMEYQETFLFGLSFRTSDALIFQLGFSRDGLLVGYSYDLTVSSLRSSSFGSHEIYVRYTIPNFIKMK